MRFAVCWRISVRFCSFRTPPPLRPLLHLSLFLTSVSHLANLVWLRPISILNRQTNTNTFYNRRVTPYRLNDPFHSASLPHYDAFALLMKASHYAPMNSSNTLTIVDITSFFSKKKSNEFIRSHATKHLNPVLQELTGESLPGGANRAPDARLDIHARGFWER